MRSRWLAVFAILSTAAGLVLLSGYVVRISVERIGANGHLSFCCIGNGVIDFLNIPRTSLPPAAGRLSVAWNRPPSMAWLTDFSYMRDDWVRLTVPIWCGLVPCLIAPTAWLCSRRRPARGYPVEPLPEPSASQAPSR